MNKSVCSPGIIFFVVVCQSVPVLPIEPPQGLIACDSFYTNGHNKLSLFIQVVFCSQLTKTKLVAYLKKPMMLGKDFKKYKNKPQTRCNFCNTFISNGEAENVIHKLNNLNVKNCVCIAIIRTLL